MLQETCSNRMPYCLLVDGSTLRKYLNNIKKEIMILTLVACARPLGPISLMYDQEMGKIALEPYGAAEMTPNGWVRSPLEL